MLRFVRRDDRPFDANARQALLPCDGALAELLFARGVTSAAMADRFLHPSADDLGDPLALPGMADAVALLQAARQEGLRAVVYGDYDADGVCAAVIATQALRQYGLDAHPHIPLRAEGYGLNLAAVEALAGEYGLLVTVDLGITNAAEVARARELGLRVLVTDHHQPGLTPCPADAVVNPQLGPEPHARYCGAGVAYQLASALLGAQVATQWLDLAAFATIADIVPLLMENRALVALGLPRIGERPGLRALMETAGCRQPLSAETVAYQLAPRVNAAGRIADAGLSVRLLLAGEDAEAEPLARALDAANTERKRLEAQATAEAALQAETHDFVRRRMLFVRGTDWNTGVVGLVAGRLNRRYGMPVCALSEEDGLLHGSLRGVQGVNLARCLQACDDLLLRYGGHEMAAGVTLAAENDDAFRDRLEHAVRMSAPDDAFVPAQLFDMPLAFPQADEALLDALARMEPFGCGNPAPVFYTGDARLERRRACGAQSAHLQLTLRQGGRQLAGIAFGMGELAATLPDTVDAAYTLALETYQVVTSVKCHIEAIRPALGYQAQAIAAEPQEAYQTALLGALQGALREAAPADAGNPPPHAEMNTADALLPDGSLAPQRGVADAETCRTPASMAIPVATPADEFAAQPVADPLPAKGFVAAPEGAAMANTAFTPDALGALLTGRQGTLLVAYTRETATAILTDYGDRVDVAHGAPDDPRCFHTLLVQPNPDAIHGRWQTVVLLDGPLASGDLPRWQSLLPAARVLAAPVSPALRNLCAALDAGDAAYRALYRRLRSAVYGSLRETAQAAGLGEAQTLAGLTAFHALGLVAFTRIPFHYNLCEPRPCSLDQSPVLGALRALTAREEVREC